VSVGHYAGGKDRKGRNKKNMRQKVRPYDPLRIHLVEEKAAATQNHNAKS